MIVGGLGEISILLLVPPIIAINSSLTILMTCWVGLSPLSTLSPTAFSDTLATKSLTTAKLTSASSSAMRISRIACLTSSSVNAPLSRSLLKMCDSLSLSEENAPIVDLLTTIFARRRGAPFERRPPTLPPRRRSMPTACATARPARAFARTLQAAFPPF